MRIQEKLLALAASMTLAACGSGNNSATLAPVPNTATAPGYALSVFAPAPQPDATGPEAGKANKPDSIIQFGNSVYIAYQKAGDVKDGSNPAIVNDVVQYDLSGHALKTYHVPGHVDGLMAHDANTLWAMANEDGGPILTTIDLTSGNTTSYTAAVTPTHGGGYDDMQMINGVTYVSASNPSNPGIANSPTVVSLTLNANKTFSVATVLDGNAQATDITPSVGGAANPNFGKPVALVLTDPDSEGIPTDASGNSLPVLMLDSQADAKLVFIKNPGPTQTISVLSLTLYNDKDGPSVPVDDTRFVPATAAGHSGPFMLFTDASNTTYRVDGPFQPGQAYSAGQGQVMQLDYDAASNAGTGHLTPIVVGIGNASALQDPHGMVFVTQ